MSDVTSILEALDRGEPNAAENLMPLVYDELRKLAGAKMAAQPPGHTLQPTALVHEAYLRLVGVEQVRWQNSRHFLAAAAEAMRQILIDSARKKTRLKRGGDRKRVDFEQVEAGADDSANDLLEPDEAPNLLAAEDSQKAEFVKLRYFAGLSVKDAGRCLGVSRATADRSWAYARAWLFDRLR